MLTFCGKRFITLDLYQIILHTLNLLNVTKSILSQLRLTIPTVAGLL